MKYLIFLLVCGGLVGCGNAPHPKTLRLNHEGAEFLKKQTFPSALDKFVEALRYDPYQSEVHLNMGLAFEGLEQSDKALQSYHQAQQVATQPWQKFMALFNEAQLLGKGKKIDEALALYQKALEIIPGSKEVKTNIELLTQDQQGQGDGEGQDQKEQDQKDKKDQKQDPKQQDKEGQDKKDPKDQNKDDQDKDKEKEDKSFKSSPKYQPRKFEGKELSESDVKKILGELRQQEQKIRAEFNRKEVKEQPRDKDW